MTTNLIPDPETGKKERLEARVSAKQKALIQRAATLQGCSLTDFMVRALQDAAHRTIREYEVLELGEHDRQVFINALLNPPVPNDRLRRAAEEYRQFRDE